jgi:hypothetical protein
MSWRSVIASQVVAVSLNFGATATAPAISVLGGQWSCGVWLNARSMHRSQFMEGWVAGYLSGLNFAFDKLGFNDTLRNVDTFSAYAWIDSWCKAHPLDDVAKAANDLADEVATRAGKAGPTPK